MKAPNTNIIWKSCVQPGEWKGCANMHDCQTNGSLILYLCRFFVSRWKRWLLCKHCSGGRWQEKKDQQSSLNLGPTLFHGASATSYQSQSQILCLQLPYVPVAGVPHTATAWVGFEAGTVCDGNGLSGRQLVAWTCELVVDGVSCLCLAMLVQVFCEQVGKRCKYFYANTPQEGNRNKRTRMRKRKRKKVILYLLLCVVLFFRHSLTSKLSHRSSNWSLRRHGAWPSTTMNQNKDTRAKSKLSVDTSLAWN